MQRIIIGIAAALGITFALFVLMAYLIKVELKPFGDAKTPSIQISMVEPDDDINIRERRLPKKPEPPKTPPPPQKQRVAKAERPKVQSMNLNMERLDVAIAGNGMYLGPPGGGNMGDGEAIPMVIIQPRYPRKAAMEGIEGWVKFRFTISPDGTPKNVELIDAKPRRIFERDARRAIYKWKFKPNVVDGKAVEQPNMIYTMQFTLAADE
ncbi:MAG: energy transducer TonB [Enterobacterales bacterium]|nr:energy transducer TonB [Enterobacterales bacterium]